MVIIFPIDKKAKYKILTIKIFFKGDEFYRVSDDSDECLLDIVSTDEIVYILDENERNTNNSFKRNFISFDGK